MDMVCVSTAQFASCIIAVERASSATMSDTAYGSLPAQGRRWWRRKCLHKPQPSCPVLCRASTSSQRGKKERRGWPGRARPWQKNWTMRQTSWHLHRS